MTKGRIVAVKRFEIHDGDGIRTTLFLKGCPLRCRWCHNPETISPRPQTAYYEAKCIGCGECVSVCEAHRFQGGRHVFARDKCVGCGRCENVCPMDALTFYGKELSPAEVLPLLTEDRIFYDGSGGGVTLSGGEPLLQAEFCAELLKLLKAEGIHTAVDTSGFAARKQIDQVIDDSDLFLYDIKSLDDAKHIRFTGQSNRMIIDNLRYILARGKVVEIRIPLIPSSNDMEVESIGQFLSSLKGRISKVKVLPYHNYSASKYQALGMENRMSAVASPDAAYVAEVVSRLRAYGLHAVGADD